MWVRLYCVQEAIVEVPTVGAPGDVPDDTYKAAALTMLDSTGGAEWETLWTEQEVSEERIPYYEERMQAEDAERALRRRHTKAMLRQFGIIPDRTS